MTRVAYWVESTRPKTLIASLSPVLIGTVVAMKGGNFHLLTLLATIAFALLIQVGTNFANDYFDFIKGADTANRKGPRRLVQAGLIPAQTMKLATHIVFCLSALVMLYLVSIGGLWIVVPLLISIALGYLYTAGPYPLAYLGISDIFVFLFFGLMATVGTTYLQTGHLSLNALIAGMGPGFLSMALLVLNNLRDVDEDRAAQKKTLPVRFGKGFGKVQFLGCLLGAGVTPIALSFLPGTSLCVLLASLFLLPSIPLMKSVCKAQTGRDLAPLFPKTGKVFHLYTALFLIGYFL